MEHFPTRFSRRLAITLSLVTLFCSVSTIVFAWGPETKTADGEIGIVHKTRENDFIGRWQLEFSEGSENVIDVGKCGAHLCITSVDTAGFCAKLIMSVEENKDVPDITVGEEEWPRFSGKFDWIDGPYSVVLEIGDSKNYGSEKPPNKTDATLYIEGSPISEDKLKEWHGRGYPLGLGFKYIGPSACIASS